jgi:hypothetical protein
MATPIAATAGATHTPAPLSAHGQIDLALHLTQRPRFCSPAAVAENRCLVTSTSSKLSTHLVTESRCTSRPATRFRIRLTPPTSLLLSGCGRWREPERFRFWGSCSKRHSPVPRISHQTLDGHKVPSTRGDHAPAATTPSFHQSHGGRPRPSRLGSTSALRHHQKSLVRPICVQG